ncbi:hypothetical protein FPQ18DRAFT_272097 [Pyronema domesticum]|uniref:Similar to RNA polymerase-associated protein C651.09c acc. no. O94667 n=1 Tax=Pyronema omphalodes (strain CBS 100304) TaxID=1076935 RepID=U4LP86_PYROM|nr:hypothetical protein FPQ18DRAFT_272097 [Pyronema domesticum]CCX33966.1 Similar to RNA polymerase-associated protein C651.09c; acc. no. O94667 [Pyronema omphalodes CBS 100304]
MNLDDELLALAGDDSDAESVQSDVSAAPPRRSPAPSSPKKRSRAPAPAKRSRKKARRDGSDDDDSEDGDVKSELSDDALSDVDSGAESHHAAQELSSASEDEDDEPSKPLYPLEGKYKDAADKAKLLAMTEIDREAVLEERMAQIEREQQDRHLRNLLKSRTAADNKAAAAASTRKSLRTKSAPKVTAEISKRGKLDELRRNREERKATGRRSSFGDEDASRKLMSDGEDDGDYHDSHYIKDERPINLDDVNSCRIGRTALSKLCDYPGFEDAVQDVFVRLSMFDKETNRNVYRMTQIKGLKTGRTYSMLDGSRRTDKHLILVHGKSERDFPMDLMSDSRFTDSEFNRWKLTLEADKISFPSVSHLRNKAKALNELATRPLTTEEVSAMIAKRNSGKADYLKSIEQRRKLQQRREEAIAAKDDDAVLQIDKELQELEDQQSGPARGETQMQRMARINAENRKRNMAEIRKAEIAEKRAHREALEKAGSGGSTFANPFMRVKTTVKFKHDMENKKDVAVGNSPPVKEKEGTGVGVLASQVPIVKGRKVAGVDDVIASMDLGIEIDI